MKVGDKVKIVSKEDHYFNIGDVGVITKVSISNLLTYYDVKIKEVHQSIKEYELELLSENSSYYSFFRFLHPNMEETTCKELFDKIIKEYESSIRIE